MASLYLHIPFCEHKCIYCDFYSVESLDSMDLFLAALRKEITLYREYGQRERIETIYFGGGTPSLLHPSSINDILGQLYSLFPVNRGAEITLEANPGTIDREKLREFRRSGINRLSIGVQSFHDDELRMLTRIHSSSQAVESVETAREAGFDNIGIDLIFALPHQTPQRWETNLEKAVSLQPRHISAYSLIVEKGTPLDDLVSSKVISPLPVEAEAGMYEFTMKYLNSAGYDHYEVSNYAQSGFRSRHNSNYWNHSNYIGFGPSAHSFWSDRRWWNVRSIKRYYERLSDGGMPIAGEEVLTREQLFNESIMLGLRSDGIDLARLRLNHELDLFAVQHETFDRLLYDGLVLIDGVKLRLTDRGFLLCDKIVEMLISHALTV